MQPDFPIEANHNVTSKVKLVRLVKSSPDSSTIPFSLLTLIGRIPMMGLTSVLHLGKNLVLLQFAFRSNKIGGSGLICFRHHFNPRICGSKKSSVMFLFPDERNLSVATAPQSIWEKRRGIDETLQGFLRSFGFYALTCGIGFLCLFV